MEMVTVRHHVVVVPPLLLLLILLLYTSTIRTGHREAKNSFMRELTRSPGRRIKQQPFKEMNLFAGAVVTYHGNIEEVNIDKVLDYYRPMGFDVLSCFDDTRIESVTVPTALPIIPVVAYARSGVRFTRTGLRDMTKENIKAFNKANGMTLGKNGPTIRLNAHGADTILKYTEGAILLIRNPRDVIISNFFYHHCFQLDLDEAVVTEWIKHRNVTWKHWIEKSIEEWGVTYLDWLDKSERLLIVFTEDVANSPIREFARMLVFVNQTVSYKTIKCITYQRSWGFRKYLDFEPYMPQELLQPAIDLLNKAMIQKGVKPLPNYPTSYLEESG